MCGTIGAMPNPATHTEKVHPDKFSIQREFSKLVGLQLYFNMCCSSRIFWAIEGRGNYCLRHTLFFVFGLANYTWFFVLGLTRRPLPCATVDCPRNPHRSTDTTNAVAGLIKFRQWRGRKSLSTAINQTQTPCTLTYHKPISFSYSYSSTYYNQYSTRKWPNLQEYFCLDWNMKIFLFFLYNSAPVLAFLYCTLIGILW